MEVNWPFVFTLCGLILGAIGAYGQLKIWLLRLWDIRKGRKEQERADRNAFYEELLSDTRILFAYGIREVTECIALGVLLILLSAGASKMEVHGIWDTAMDTFFAALGAFFGAKTANLSLTMRKVLQRL